MPGMLPPSTPAREAKRAPSPVRGGRGLSGNAINLVLRIARLGGPVSRLGARFIFKYYLC